MPRVLMVTSEAVPFVKTGGLADVMGALPAALAGLGWQVAVVLPRYAVAQVEGCERIWQRMTLWVGSHIYNVAIDQLIRDNVRYLFVDCPPLYDRDGVYNINSVDFRDNHLRFALLNQAALGVARYIFRPDVFHCHDWPTGLVPLYLRETFRGDPTFLGSKSVYTIHNLGYQGNFGPWALGDLGLSPALYNPGGLELNGNVSFMKAGLVWADAITTVSPTYAREIQTPEYGFGLDGLLRSRSGKLSGILDGVDYQEWNPELDHCLPVRFSASDLSGKKIVKRLLMEQMGLPVNDAKPVMGVVSRFADQKGFDLVSAATDELAQLDIAMVVLGSGESRFENLFRDLARRHPEKFAVRIGYDEALSHRIVGGSDLFLMPSRYEPCGLSQIYSLRYGTVPIVRATGGLEDTVEPETGFKFTEYSAAAMMNAVRLALKAFQEPSTWKLRMQRGMARNFSWAASAAEYIRLYQSL